MYLTEWMDHLTSIYGFSEGDALPDYDHAEAVRDWLVAVCNRFFGPDHPIEAIPYDPDRTFNPFLIRFKRRHPDTDASDLYVDLPSDLYEFLSSLDNEFFYLQHVRVTVEIDNTWQSSFDTILSRF